MAGGSKKVLEISVACASRLEARVECVLEALAARGHAATLHTGASAREALLAADTRSLRVLLLGERLDPEQLQTLEQGLDPDRLGNLLVTTIDRSAPDMAERIEAFARVALASRPKRPPAVRLSDPVAPPAKPRNWAVPLGVAAVAVVGLCVALQYGLQPQAKPESEPSIAGAPLYAAPEPAVVAAPDREPSAAAPITVSVELSDEEIEIFDIERARPKRARKAPASTSAPTHASRPSHDAARPGPIAKTPALGSTAPLGLSLSPRGRDLPAPGEEQRLH
jgi:hypothetical protein